MSKACIVVTGASKGIGAAIALTLAEQGHHVACLSRSGTVPVLDGISAEVSARMIAGRADVSKPETMAHALKQLKDAGWSIQGLVNNAGLHVDAPSATLALDQWQQMMDMNATSVLTGCQAVYPYLLENQGGVIVNIGSFFDKLGVKRNVAYCASKAAVGAITRCLAVEWGNKGIRVVNVAPGYIETDLNADAMGDDSPLRQYLAKRIPGGVPGKSKDVGALVASMFGPAGAFLSGETIYIDGGQSIAH